jgi:hypothetical protein
MLAAMLAAAASDLFGPVVSTRAFAIGLVYGAVAYLALGILAAVRPRVAEGAGVAFAAAVILAARDMFGPAAAPWRFAGAIALLGLGGALAVRMRPRSWARWYVGFGRTAVALAPGAVALAVAFPAATPGWLRIAAAVAALATGVAVHDFDAAQGATGAPFVLLAISAVAVYFTVPDTELPLVMVGGAVPLAFLSFPQPLRRLGPAGAAAAMGVFAWVVVIGGRARAGAAVAGIAALGLLVMEPIGRRIPKSATALVRRQRRGRPGRSDAWIVVVLVAGVAQLALGIFCARIAGRETDTVLAALMAAPALVLVGAAGPFLLPLKGKDASLHRRHSRPGGGHRHRGVPHASRRPDRGRPHLVDFDDGA